MAAKRIISGRSASKTKSENDSEISEEKPMNKKMFWLAVAALLTGGAASAAPQNDGNQVPEAPPDPWYVAGPRCINDGDLVIFERISRGAGAVPTTGCTAVAGSGVRMDVRLDLRENGNAKGLVPADMPYAFQSDVDPTNPCKKLVANNVDSCTSSSGVYCTKFKSKPLGLQCNN
jgi:hypothetical protein